MVPICLDKSPRHLGKVNMPALPDNRGKPQPMPVRSIVSKGLAARMLAVLAVMAVAAAPLPAQERFVQQSTGATAAQVATAPHGMVVSQEQQATRIGLDVLERGGN